VTEDNKMYLISRIPCTNLKMKQMCTPPIFAVQISGEHKTSVHIIIQAFREDDRLYLYLMPVHPGVHMHVVYQRGIHTVRVRRGKGEPKGYQPASSLANLKSP
jgi:hypothetical protein